VGPKNPKEGTGEWPRLEAKPASAKRGGDEERRFPEGAKLLFSRRGVIGGTT